MISAAKSHTANSQCRCPLPCLLLIIALVSPSIASQAQGRLRRPAHRQVGPSSSKLGSDLHANTRASGTAASGVPVLAKEVRGDIQCVGIHLFDSSVTLPVLSFPIVLDLHNSSATPVIINTSSLAFFALEAKHDRREVTQQVYFEPDSENPTTVAPQQSVHLKFQLQLFKDAPTGRIQVEPRITWFHAGDIGGGAGGATPPAPAPTVSQIKLYVDGDLQATTVFHSAWKATGHSQIGRGLLDGKSVDFVHGTIADARAYQRALSGEEIHALFMKGSNPHWQFDQSTSSLTSPGNQGTLMGGVSIIPGQTTLDFDGVSGYVELHEGVLDTSRSYTVSAWIKLSSLTGYQTFVSQDGARISGFYLQKRGDDDALALAVRTADAADASLVKAEAPFVPRVDVLYHIVGVYESAVLPSGATESALALGSTSGPPALDHFERLDTVTSGPAAVLNVMPPGLDQSAKGIQPFRRRVSP